MNDRLKTIQTWLQTEIAPLANQLDHQPEALKLALQTMSDRNANHKQKSLLALNSSLD